MCNGYVNSKPRGFTLLELITVLAITAIIGALAGPPCMRYYQTCCVKAAMMDIVQMVREGKMMSLEGNYHAIIFDPVAGTATLLAGKGPDGKWKTADDLVVRTMRLRNKGGSLRFGCEGCTPISGRIKPDDGIALEDNMAIFNEMMTGRCSGTVYITSSSGVTMALGMNSEDAGYKLWFWNGNRWVQW